MSTLAPNQVTTSSHPVAARATAVVAAVLGTPYALLNLYWAAGGTGLLRQYGSHVFGQAVPGDTAFRTWSAVLAVLMAAAVVSGLAATSGPTRPAARWIAGLSGGWIALYGVAMTFIGVAVPLALYSDSVFDPAVYRWHVLLWDPWFAIWGLLLLTAVALSAPTDD